MPKFEGYSKSTRADSPRYYQGAIADEQADAAARQQQFMEMLSAIQLYNEGMGDSTPIADWLRSFNKSAQATPQAGSQASDYTGKQMQDWAAKNSGTTATAGSSAADYSGQQMKDWTAEGVNAASGAGTTAATTSSSGAGAAGGAAAGGSAAGGSAAGGSAAGGSAAGGSAAGGGGFSSVAGNPYAWLAAAIAANEADAKRGGYRADSKTEQIKDIITGKNMEVDFTERFPEKLGIKFSDNAYGDALKEMITGATGAGRPGSELVKPKQMFKPYKQMVSGTNKLVNKGIKDTFDYGADSVKKLLKYDPVSSALRKLV